MDRCAKEWHCDARRPTACLLTSVGLPQCRAAALRQPYSLPAAALPLGVQGLVEWGEHEGMRTPLGVRGKWNMVFCSLQTQIFGEG